MTGASHHTTSSWQLGADVGGGRGECGGSSGTQHPAPGTSITLLICHAVHSTEHLTYCLVTQGSFVKLIVCDPAVGGSLIHHLDVG